MPATSTYHLIIQQNVFSIKGSHSYQLILQIQRHILCLGQFTHRVPEVDQKEGMALQGNQICKIYKFKPVTGTISWSSTALLKFCVVLPKSEPGSNMWATQSPLLLNSQNRKFNFDQNPYSSSQNVLFDKANRYAKQIFQIFKIEGVIFVDFFRLANRY